jgi:hypothetical protein
MDFQLSDEERRRIEQEEKVRLAEERYRAEVRERLTSAPEPKKPRSNRTLWIVLIVLFLLWAMSRSHT